MDQPTAPPFRRSPPLVLGLVGGIAAGKSTVASAFADHGLQVLDADALARQQSADPTVQAAVQAAFGPAILQNGELDRAALGKLVFADPAARQRLEAILHPRILQAIEAALQNARAAGRSVLLDAPLLLETGLDRCCDLLVFVAAPAELREARAARRGWPAGELARREAAQLPLATKQARAQLLIHNDGSEAATRAQVAAILAALATGSGTNLD